MKREEEDEEDREDGLCFIVHNLAPISGSAPRNNFVDRSFFFFGINPAALRFAEGLQSDNLK